MYLEPTERVWWLQMSFSHWGANSAPPNPLAEFEGQLRGGKEVKGKGRGEEQKERKGTAENTPRNKFLVTTLTVAVLLGGESGSRLKKTAFYFETSTCY